MHTTAARHADGGLYLCTPLDPLLLLLPLLERARAQQNVFTDVEQILRCSLLALDACMDPRADCGRSVSCSCTFCCASPGS